MIQIDIPMPEKCGLCPCFHFEQQMYCQAVKADKNKKIVNPYGSPRPEWCPLKEHEAVEPIPPTDGLDLWKCGNCNNQLFRCTHQKYCEMCGKAVKWE